MSLPLSYLDARAAAGAATRPTQGDLTDAAYFDYIAWAQWGAVDLALVDAVAGGARAAASGFDEACDPETEAGCPPDAGARHVVRSSPPPASLAAARAEFAAGAGARVLAGLRSGFQGAPVDGVPPVDPAAPADARPALAALARALVAGGYALSADVSEPAPATLALRCEGPAVLWGARARAAAGAPPDDLAAVVGSALLAGVAAGAPVVTATETATVATWRLVG
jgi:hypothetical protein